MMPGGCRARTHRLFAMSLPSVFQSNDGSLVPGDSRHSKSPPFSGGKLWPIVTRGRCQVSFRQVARSLSKDRGLVV